jgi:hypothetical protein
MVSNTSSVLDRKPAYIAFKTFLTAIETLEQGVPPIIDRYVWRTFSGSLQAQTLSAFKFLGLVDETGRSQPILQKIVDAKGEERKPLLQELIKDKYSDAIKLGESNASFQQLQDLIRSYGVSGRTLEIAVRFLTDACTYTGLKCSPHWTLTKRTRRSVNKKEAIITKPNINNTPIKIDKPNLPKELELHPMILGLIKELPQPNSILDTKKRESLKQYFDIVLNILYKNEENK